MAMNFRSWKCQISAARALLISAALIFFPVAASAQQSAPTGISATKENAAETAAIKSVLDAYTEEWNRSDAHALSLLFTEDCDYTAVTGANSHGREAIEKVLAANFDGQFKNSTRTDSVKRMRFLSPDIASLDDYWILTAPNTDRPRREGYYHWILIRRNGKWLVALHHAADFPTPAPPAAK
jgi:uncharacterized protein (TIGR02246 family)